MPCHRIGGEQCPRHLTKGGSVEPQTAQACRNRHHHADCGTAPLRWKFAATAGTLGPPMERALILDFDRSVAPLAGAHAVDLTDWQPRIRYGCSLADLGRLEEVLSARAVPAAP